MELNEKQIKIIETAEKLFALHGFAGTSIRDISKEAGINIAMVSYYFGSKEKLMEAIFHHRISHAWMAAREVLGNTTKNSWEKMEFLVDSFVEGMANKHYFHSLIMRQQLMGDTGPIAELLENARTKNCSTLADIIEEGQQSGLFKPEIDATLILFTMVGTSYQCMHSKDFYRRRHNLQDLEEQEFFTELKKRLKAYLKTLLKAILKKDEAQF